jgi:hypothetical protein
MHAAPVVYLDSQDFSRFGDVLRGKSDDATEKLFLDLETRAKAGSAIFSVSMPHYSELLQYDAGHRETTIKKAEAVERLCGTWALAYPSRLIASEIGEVCRRHGLSPQSEFSSVLSAERYWYPNVASAFDDIRTMIRGAVDVEIDALQLPSRALRRKARSLAKKLDISAAAKDAAPGMAAKFGLPVSAITGSIVALLKGRATPEEASQRLFRAIAAPVTFVEAYFEKVEVDRAALPAWMRDMGLNFEKRFAELRDQLEPYRNHADTQSVFMDLLKSWPATLGKSVLAMADGELAEFGVDAAALEALTTSDDFALEVPACGIVGHVLTNYAHQVLGFAGSVAGIEHSFGGDLIHALYLTHVDLWRGDRRFAPLVIKSAPRFANRVVPKLTQLTAAIDAWHANEDTRSHKNR